MERPVLPGILFEGHECSGKTTVARLVAADLKAAGWNVAQAHATVSASGLLDAMLHEAVAIFEDSAGRPFRDPRLWRRFNSVRSAQLMIDAEMVAQREPPGPHDVFVQDRHWLTQHAFNTFLTPDAHYLTPEWTRTHAPRFTVQVYLTCDPATRLERTAARRHRPAKHAVNAFLQRHTDEIALLDELTIEQLLDDAEWTVLSSTGCTARALADQVLRLLYAQLPRPHRAHPGGPRVTGRGCQVLTRTIHDADDPRHPSYRKGITS
jgi:thymidylate kinase